MRLLSLLLPAALVASVFFGGCASENLEDLTGTSVDAPCDTTAVATFSGVVQPIIARYGCASTPSCHGTGGAALASFPRFNYETVVGLQNAVQDGRLLGAIEHRPGFNQMPKDIAPLLMDRCDILRIKQWVRRGAPAD